MSNRNITAKEGTIVPEESATMAVSQEFAAAKEYQQLARLHLHAAAGYMVLTGLELKRLRATHGETRGAGLAKDKARNIPWSHLVKQELGISDETARKYIAMAEAAKNRLPIIKQLEQKLLSTPLAMIEEKEQLVQATLKLTDGHSAKSFMEEMGIAKPPPGIREENRNKGGNSTQRKLTPAEEAQGKFLPLLNLLTGHRLDNPNRWGFLLHHLPLDLTPDQSPNQVASLVTLEAELNAWLAVITPAKEAIARALQRSRKSDPDERLTEAQNKALAESDFTPPEA